MVKLILKRMAKTKTPANIVGKQVQKLRLKLGLTQEELAGKCQLHGWDVSRATISQIEASLRTVRDRELVYLSVALEATIGDLFPKR